MCTIEGCKNPISARGWCRTHWQWWRLWHDPQFALRLRTIERNYRKRHPGRGRATLQKYRRAHREQIAAYQRAWKQANAKRHCEHEKKRRRWRGPGGDQPPGMTWAALVAAYDGRCAYCGATGKLEQDHVVPLHRGGKHEPGNVVPVCGPCNRAKGKLLLSEWWQERAA